MDRRSKTVSGWVNFPVDSTEYVCTREGGLFVYMAVLDSQDSNWAACCDIGVHAYLDAYAGPVPDRDGNFPFIGETEEPSHLRYRSLDYLAMICVGSTGWSGANNDGDYWFCRGREDLTDSGRAMHDMIASLYPGCEIRYLTMLDT